MDDDAPGDPGPGDPTISDPLENGTPEHPFDAIQEGIDSAQNGETVYVLDGHYGGVGNKNLDYGGRALMVRSASGPEQCVIDGGNNSRGVFFRGGETASAILDGFTIANGFFEVPGSEPDGGGGIACKYGSSPTIRNCVIRDCETTGSFQGLGGGIYCSEGSAPTIVDCTLADNIAQNGGGIACRNSNPTIQSCIIVDNDAARSGGGLYCEASSPIIADCTISRNETTRENGGGLDCRQGSAPRVERCDFTDNFAYQGGGALYADRSSPSFRDCIFARNRAQSGGGALVKDGAAGFTDCIFRENVAGGGGGGGGASCDGDRTRFVRCFLLNNVGNGIRCRNAPARIIECTISGNSRNGLYGDRSDVLVRDCIISNNAPLFSSGTGGGAFFTYGRPVIVGSIIMGNQAASRGGGLALMQSDGIVANCAIINNTASSEGGGLIIDGHVTVTGCTVTDNVVRSGAFDGGGGILAWGNNHVITNTVLWDNESAVGPQLALARSASVRVEYCDVREGPASVAVENGSTLNWGVGNLDVDPLLVRAGIHLQATSPCIAAGDPAKGVERIDIDGEPRGAFGRTDIGADEFVDTDTDGLPDWWEQLHFGSTTAADPMGDEDADGRLNLDEYNQSHDPWLPRINYYVDVNGDDNWDGLAPVWNGVHGPKRTIQAAIDVTHAEEGDYVNVADGIYFGAGNINLVFGGKLITVRSANGPENCIIDCRRNGRGFTFDADETFESVVEGLTITNGVAEKGGAVFCDQSNPIIRGCILINNRSQGHPARTAGAAIYCDEASPAILDCTIMNNESETTGGGVYSLAGAPTIENCRISDNVAVAGGGLWCKDGTVVVRRCTITGNSANSGAGVFDATDSGQSLFLTSCVISGNTSLFGPGGIECRQTTITNCRITENVATRSDSRGGALGGFGATLTNCTIAGNVAASYGIDCFAGTWRLTNCVIWDNALAGEPQIHLSSKATLDISNSCLEEGAVGVFGTGTLIWGAGNIEADPQFAFPRDDFHIIRDSPCIDAGRNTNLPVTLPARDLDGTDRILDGDGNGSAVVDMGSYEFDLAVPRIAVAPRQIEFWALAGEPNPPDQVFGVQNVGGRTLRWQIVEFCDWLAAAPVTGESIGEIDEINLRIDTANLTAGDYTCDVAVLGQQAPNSPQLVTVTLRVRTIRRVPSAYATIQAAIDASAPRGDIVQIAAGTYAGFGNRDLDFAGRALIVRGEEGAAATIIDCEGLGRGFNFHSEEGALAVVTDLTITNGSAARGAAILSLGSATPTISNCIIQGNTSSGAGGGIFSDTFSLPTVRQCVFRDNVAATEGGGIYGFATIEMCRFENNMADGGGGMATGGTLDRCVFLGNHAARSGGAAKLGRQSVLTNCVMIGNSSDRYGGAVYVNSSSSAGNDFEFRNCLIAANDAAQEGGAIYADRDARVVLVNCTVADNTATSEGGALFGEIRCTFDVANCVLFLDRANVGPEIALSYRCTAMVSYSDIEGGQNAVTIGNFSALIWGDGNIDADPLFVDPAAGDLRLLPGAPGIDAADNTAVPADIVTDLDGDSRFHDDPGMPDTGVPGNGYTEVVDMGAYEFQGTTFWRGDLNCDGFFNGADIDPFFLALGDPAGYAIQFPNCDIMLGDMNCDNRVNGGDIDEFFRCLGVGGCSCP